MRLWINGRNQGLWNDVEFPWCHFQSKSKWELPLPMAVVYQCAPLWKLERATKISQWTGKFIHIFHNREKLTGKISSHNKAGADYKSTANPLEFLNGNGVLLLRSYISKWSQIFNSCIIHFINYDQVEHLLKFHNVQFMGKRKKPLSSHWSSSISVHVTGLQQMS